MTVAQMATADNSGFADVSAANASASEIASAWATLAAGCEGATLFAAPQFQIALRTAFDLPDTCITAHQDGALAGVLPLCPLPQVRSMLGLRETGFARNAHTLRNHLLTDDPAIIAALLHLWRDNNRADTLLLENLPQSLGLAEAIHTAVQGEDLRSDAPTPGRVLSHATISGSYDSYLGSRSGQFRRQLRKRSRELERAGVFRLERLTHEAITSALPDWQAIVAQSWQGQSTQPAAGNTPADWALHAALAQIGVLWLARLDGRPVAALRMLEDRRAAYVHTMHFDQHLRDHAPGLVLFEAMMRDACARSVPRVDFNGASAFFDRWATGATPHMSIRIYRHSLRGRGAQVMRSVLRGLNPQSAVRSSALGAAPKTPPVRQA